MKCLVIAFLKEAGVGERTMWEGSVFQEGMTLTKKEDL